MQLYLNSRDYVNIKSYVPMIPLEEIGIVHPVLGKFFLDGLQRNYSTWAKYYGKKEDFSLLIYDKRPDGWPMYRTRITSDILRDFVGKGKIRNMKEVYDEIFPYGD